MENILDTIKGQLGEDTINKLSAQLGENSDAVKKAIDSLLPNIMNGISEKGKADGGFMANLDVDGDGDVDFSDLTSFAGSMSDTAMGYVNSIFGDKKEEMQAAVSQDAGISEESAGSLMDSLTAMVMSNVTKMQSQTGVDFSSILGGLQAGAGSLLSSGGKQLNDLLGGQLDADGDGNIGLEDVKQFGKGLLGKFGL